VVVFTVSIKTDKVKLMGGYEGVQWFQEKAMANHSCTAKFA
jgi:hypothetical protein